MCPIWLTGEWFGIRRFKNGRLTFKMKIIHTWINRNGEKKQREKKLHIIAYGALAERANSMMNVHKEIIVMCHVHMFEENNIVYVAKEIGAL